MDVLREYVLAYDDLLGEFDPTTGDRDDLDDVMEYLAEIALTTPQADGVIAQQAFGLWVLERFGDVPAGPAPVNRWQLRKDGDDAGRRLYERHYSADKKKRRRKPSKLFVGPGEKLVLLTAAGDALFAWRVERYRYDGMYGVNCTVFRNESDVLSSQLVLEAEAWARWRWPHLARLFTYVSAPHVRSANPGYCFKMAGWRKVGDGKEGKVVLEKVEVPFVWLFPKGSEDERTG